jgi:superfamily II DNA or RNA helicase
MRLRDYQFIAKQACHKSWAEGARAVAGRMFTGGGKTVLFSHIIKDRLPGRAMVLAHRRELIWQAREKIERVTGLQVGVEMGEYKSNTEQNLMGSRDQIIVSTVQTHVAGGDGAGRIGKFDPMDFATLIIDECHRAVSPSYRRTIDYYLTNPDLVVLGVTATPDRADEQALGQVFETVPEGFDYDMNYGRINGWLAEIEQQSVNIEALDFSEIRTTSEDLNQSDLSKLMESEKPLYGIVDATLDIVGNKRGIGFSPSVEHARMTAEIFNRYNPGSAAFISGKTDKDERKKINSDFKAGKIRWIWNCGTHTEGFDDAGVEVVIPKPTRSRALYEQMVGRATRPADVIASRLGTLPAMALRRGLIARSEKPTCLVLDFYGNAGKHKLITAFDILAGDMSEEAIQMSINLARQSAKPVRVAKSLEEEEQKQIEIKARREVDEARRSRLKAKAKYSKAAVDPFDVLDVKPVAARGWDEGKQLTEKQRNILKKQGYDPDQMEYARAKQLVGIIVSRWENKKCSIKQAALLERCGWTKAEASDMGFEQASKAIDAAAKNGWQRPESFEAPPGEQKSPMTNLDIPDDDIPF